MNPATNHTQSDTMERDLRLPDHRREERANRGPFQLLGVLAGAVGVGIVAIVYMVGAPIVAFITGAGQIALEIRENAVRPRPFVGARHGLPFLDPPALPPVPAADTDETED